MRCAVLLLRTLEAVEGELCLLQELEMMLCTLLCMLEAVEGRFCSLEVLRMLKVMRFRNFHCGGFFVAAHQRRWRQNPSSAQSPLHLWGIISIGATAPSHSTCSMLAH